MKRILVLALLSAVLLTGLTACRMLIEDPGVTEIRADQDMN